MVWSERQVHWDNGYPTSTSYTCGFFKELSPNWLDFAALVKGYQPPRRAANGSFRYVDLGCGMGYGLCLLAALYPEAEFVGIDFHPDHHAHADDLRLRLGLTNIEFILDDFLILAKSHELLGRFQYVVSHGIATWVHPRIQEALLSLASSVLAPGGLFYCSYNALPGWLSGSIFNTLVTLELQRCDKSNPLSAIKSAGDILQQLLGPEDKPTPLSKAQPLLQRHLKRINSQDPNYVTQEYIGPVWQPVYAFELHRKCLQHRLSYIASATLPELGDDLLPKNLRVLAQSESNSLIRETLIDLATNKSFRRDIFVKGRNALPISERLTSIGSVTVRILEANPQNSYTFHTCYGTVTGEPSHYRALENLLSKGGPLSLSELATALKRSLPEILGMVLLLLHEGRIGLDRNSSVAQAECSRISPILSEMVLGGKPYNYFPAPMIGSALSISVVETLTAKAVSDGLDSNMAATCVQVGLKELGRRLNNNQGRPYDDPEKEHTAIQAIVQQFLAFRKVALENVGVRIC